MLSLPNMLHMMQYWQSIRQSVGLALIRQAGKQKKPCTSIQLGILIFLCKRMMERRKSCILTSPSAISWARFLSWRLHHFIWFRQYHILPCWWRQQVLEKCCYTSCRPHGMKSQNTVIFTVTTKIASDFIKIILLLSFMIHFDSLVCCMK
jgi:hypothetical protein